MHNAGKRGNRMEKRDLKKLSREELILLLADEADKEDRPGQADIYDELERIRYGRKFRETLRTTIFGLITVAAVAVLISMLMLPVLKIYGDSMSPTVQEGEIVLAVKGSDFKQGDVIAFYYGNKLLIKRFIAGPGDWIRIDEEGNVFVNDKELDEPYLQDKALGSCNIEFPYQVPENEFFVMGDNRSVSMDSRNTLMGCVAEEQVMGKVVFRIWPLNRFGSVNS